MPEYQRQTLPFLHKGMNWNVPPDKMSPGQLPWCKNVRVLKQGTISSAHGYTPAATSLSEQYLHSLSTLEIANPAFDPDLKATFVLGGDRKLFIYQTDTTLQNPVINPVDTPQGRTAAFSGNPLSIVDAQPAGAAVAWKYLGDSQQMATAGYYPSDQSGTDMARVLTMGLTPPVNDELPLLSDGQLTGDYQWCFAYRRVQTGARSNPSSATRFSVTHPAFTLLDSTVTMTLPPAPLNPQTGAPDTLNVVVDVYRFGGKIFRWALVGSGLGGSTFVDNVPDLQLLAAPSPPQATDPATGLTRFNLYRPFVTQDIARSGSASVQQPYGSNITVLWWVSGPAFNVNWVPGSTIMVNGKAFTIQQVRSDTVLELAQDITGVLTVGTTYTWSTDAGTLTAGQPLAHLWGVYGVGQSASYLFACGDPNAQSTVYWTNGNDPDSTDVVNNLIVTSPSERLQTGCIYDGQPFCWTTERQFQLFPSLTVFGQFTAQEVAGGRGCWLEWSLSVQNNGMADQSVTWRGKDGLYDWSVSGGLRRLSDDLFAFFPHDNEPGFAPETLMTFIGPTSSLPEHVGNLDDSQPKYHRTCWFQGVLFYDFVAQTTPQGNTWSTLVFDDVECKGWVSLDQPFATTDKPIARGIDVIGNNLKVSWGGSLYDYFGYVRGFPTRVITPAMDQGDPRANKLYGDYWLDCTPYASFQVYPLVNYHRTTLANNTVPVSGSRGEFVLDFLDYVDNTNSGNPTGLLNQTLGLDLRWTANDGPFVASLNQWGPTFVFKPESITWRISDRTDEGVAGAKYLMGMVMEANTFNTSFPLAIVIDGVLIDEPTILHNGQTERPYAWTPVAGYEFQVEIRFGTTAVWQLYKIRWIFEPWPEAVARSYPFMDLGTAGSKYIRQIVLPIETGGVAGTVGLLADDGQPMRTFPGLTTPALLKSGKELSPMLPPVIAHEIQFSTLTPMRIWPDQIKVEFEPWPELSTSASAFSDLGYKGAKFMQGCIVPMDTNCQPVQLEIASDNNWAVPAAPALRTGPMPQVLVPPSGAGYDMRYAPHGVTAFEYSGKQYIFAVQGNEGLPGGTYDIHVQKSTDNGATWTGTGTISFTSSPVNAYTICVDGGTVYILSVDTFNGSTGTDLCSAMRMWTYDLSTDTGSGSSTPSGAPQCYKFWHGAIPSAYQISKCVPIHLVRRGAGDMLLVFSGVPETIGGSRFARLYVSTFNGSAFGTPVLIPGQAGNSIAYTSGAVDVDSSGYLHVCFVPVAVGIKQYLHIAMNPSGSFGSVQTVESAGFFTHLDPPEEMSRLVVFGSSIGFVGVRDDGGSGAIYFYSAPAGDLAPAWTSSPVGNSTPVVIDPRTTSCISTSAALLADNTIHVFWTRSGTSGGDWSISEGLGVIQHTSASTGDLTAWSAEATVLDYTLVAGNWAAANVNAWSGASVGIGVFGTFENVGPEFGSFVALAAASGGGGDVDSSCAGSGAIVLGPVTTPGAKKTPVAFSFSPCNATPSDPFIAHEVQVRPLSPARVWFDEITWVWEPAPELAYTWDTQPTDHDIPGWHSQRDCYIAYQGGSGAPVLIITTEYGAVSYPLDPVTNNQYVRCYRVLQPQKAKWRSYRVENCGGLRLYKKDCEVRVKGWGSTGPYVSVLPFGGPSRADGARI